MFGGVDRSLIAVGVFVLTAIAVCVALYYRDRGEMRRRQHSRELFAQRDNLKYHAHIGEIAARPSSPRPNDIT